MVLEGKMRLNNFGDDGKCQGVVGLVQIQYTCVNTHMNDLRISMSESSESIGEL